MDLCYESMDLRYAQAMNWRTFQLNFIQEANLYQVLLMRSQAQC